MQTKLYIDNALSMYNGIMLYSKRHKNKVAVATIYDHKITTSWVDVDIAKKYETLDEKGHKKIDKTINFFKRFLLVEFLVIAFLIIIFNFSLKIIVRPIYFDIIIITLLGFLCSDDRRRRFHGAEHQMVNAFNKLKRIPTMDELQKFSRFSTFCGTNALADIVLIFLILLLEEFISYNAVLFIGTGGLFIIHILNFFQYFTTSQPTDREQKVAIEAIKIWFEYESKEE